MRSLVCAAIAVALVSSDPTARADQASASPRLELGASLGFGVPLGSVASGIDFNTFISNKVPIELDAGLVLGDSWYLGTYFQYGIGSIPSMFATTCSTTGVSCTIFDGRFGGDVQFRSHTGRDQVWAGVGFGYEWYGIDVSSGAETGSIRLSGWEFVNLQAGYDYLLRPNVGFGPFVALSMAQFKDASANIAGMALSGDVASQALHEWLVFGVRGIVDVTFTPSKHQAPEPVEAAPPEVTDPDAQDSADDSASSDPDPRHAGARRSPPSPPPRDPDLP